MAHDPLKKIAEAPAEALEAAVEEVEKLNSEFQNVTPIRKLETFWKKMGPGIVTGAADDDPSGIATYSQTGAQFGYQFTWLALFTFPLMAIVQEMCARIGMVTKRGLASNIRTHFPRWVLILTTALLFGANAFNIGADLGAMADATRLILPGISYGVFVVLFAIIVLNLEIFIPYQRYAKLLKWLTMALLAYVFTAFVVPLDWKTIWHATFIPHITFDRDEWYLVAAFIGTTISPYLFFWQSSQEVEEEHLHHHNPQQLGKEIKDMRKDVWLGMFISNAVAFFIIIVCAATLFHNGTNIETAAQAAAALKPLAGTYASLLFTLGIIGTGLLAIPVLAGSSAYAFAEARDWRQGLHFKLKQASAFYGVMIIAVLCGLSLNFIGLNPIKALIYSAVINAIISPVCLILIVLLASNEQVMGQWVNKKYVTKLGWLTVALVSLAAAIGLFSLI